MYTSAVFSPETAAHVKRINVNLPVTLTFFGQLDGYVLSKETIKDGLSVTLGKCLNPTEIVLLLQRNLSKELTDSQAHFIQEVVFSLARLPSKPAISFVVANLNRPYGNTAGRILAEVLSPLREESSFRLLSFTNLSTSWGESREELLANLCPSELIIRQTRHFETFYSRICYDRLKSLSIVLDANAYGWMRQREIDSIFTSALPYLEHLDLNVFGGKKVWKTSPASTAPRLRRLSLKGDEGKSLNAWEMPVLAQLELHEISQSSGAVQALYESIAGKRLPSLKRITLRTVHRTPPSKQLQQLLDTCSDAGILCDAEVASASG